MLSSAQMEEFRRDGFVVVRGLIDEQRCLRVLSAIDQLLCAKWPRFRPSAAGRLHDDVASKVLEVASFDRRGLGRLYDAIRKISAFWTISSEPAFVSHVAQLLGSDAVGMAFRGCGIRLDLPNEDRWRSPWHQEYHSQISSPNALTAWCSFVGVSHAMGPVEFLAGSHREGLLPVSCDDPMNERHDYTTSFRIPNVDDLRAKYPSVSLETGMGDVVFLDFFTVHQSGFNRDAERVRVTGQVRYFDMLNEASVAQDWVGGWQEGGDFRKLHPGYIVA